MYIHMYSFCISPIQVLYAGKDARQLGYQLRACTAVHSQVNKKCNDLVTLQRDFSYFIFFVCGVPPSLLVGTRRLFLFCFEFAKIFEFENSKNRLPTLVDSGESKN
jgi:hypothetical protein